MTSIMIKIGVMLSMVILCAPLALGDDSPEGHPLDTLEAMGIGISGAIEVEAGHTSTDNDDNSDITLATVELGIDVKPMKHVSGHIVFLYEEDDTDLEIDQGYLRLDGEDRCPFYMEVGRLYLPFGSFDSSFVSDPLTLELGEARETALVVGYANEPIQIALGVFNGEVNETDSDNDGIDGYAASVTYTMPARGRLSFSAGGAYISNIGDSDGLTDQLATDDTVSSYVPGLTAHGLIGWNEQMRFTLEYMAALNSFESGDLAFDNGREVTPTALNMELAYVFTPQWEAALRYGTSDESGDFLPESLYGGVVTYTASDHVSLAFEIQSGEYEDGSDTTSAILQLALAF